MFFTNTQPADVLTPFVMISIDPGSVTMGVCVSVVTPFTKKMSVAYADTINFADLLKAKFDSGVEHFDAGFARMLVMGQYLQNLFNMYQPSVIAVEASYLGQHASAYKLLTMTMLTIQTAAFQYYPFVLFKQITPSSVKKDIDVNGGSGDKTLIPIALAKQVDVLDLSQVNLTQLDQHAHDAIAVGYSFFKHEVLGI